MSKVVNIFLSSFFSDDLNYPTGICILNDEIYEVDGQNNRVKVYNLSGVLQRSFTSTLSFPEFITTDGTYLYITDSGNNRITKHQPDGTLIDSFGSYGTGNDEFAFPKGIIYYDGKLFIADTQNDRIKIHLPDGTFVAEIIGFYLPEGVCIANDNIIVSDTGNNCIKFLDLATHNLLITTDFELSFPNQVKETNGILTLCEKNNNRIIFIDFYGKFISDFAIGMNFPSDIFYQNDKIYLINYETGLTSIYEFTVIDEYPKFAAKLLKLTKQLYPIARAWIMKKGSFFEKIHEALAYSESRTRETLLSILTSIIPDNDSFTAEDALNFERGYGLYKQPSINLETRKEAILRKMKHPGTVLGRQSYLYIQGQLQEAGFDCYVHENRFGDPPAIFEFISAIYGSIFYGEVPYGYNGGDFSQFEPVANHIDESKDAGYLPGNQQHQRYIFFIGGEIFPNPCYIEDTRKKEFRELILRLKPAQTVVGLLLAEYIEIDAFEITINTALGSGTTFTLPTIYGYTYDAYVDWYADGSYITHVTSFDVGVTHDYGTDYNGKIRITGTLGAFSFNNSGDKLKLTQINQWGNVGFEYLNSALYGCINLTSLPSIGLAENSIGNFDNFVRDCASLTSFPVDTLRRCIYMTKFNSGLRSSGVTSLHSDTLKYNILLSQAINTFALMNLDSLPPDLLRYNTQLTTVAGIFLSTVFTNKNIPENLFYYNYLITDYTNALFNVRNMILPNVMFNLNNLSIVTTFSQFMYIASTSYSNTGTIQDIWNYALSATSVNALLNQTALSNYASIPNGWKGL